MHSLGLNINLAILPSNLLFNQLTVDVVSVIYVIICVDDDPIILQMLGFHIQKMFKFNNLEVEFYANAIEAIEGIKSLKNQGYEPLLLLTDFQMPEMNGAELIRTLKHLYNDLSCVMLSGEANAIQVDDLVNEDLLDAFITKPWSEKDLINAIGPILENKNFQI
ncbi:MAG: response regulator [Crocinitomicaceae bacterium]|nr:response regulator [Crocinitomicaceae bacterium]MCF8433284.1 response regulator [Crocinitomicaceae bacterium]